MAQTFAIMRIEIDESHGSGPSRSLLDQIVAANLDGIESQQTGLLITAGARAQSINDIHSEFEIPRRGGVNARSRLGRNVRHPERKKDIGSELWSDIHAQWS